MERKSTNKLEALKSVELIFNNEIKLANQDKPKYFITFPYPYMNGKLHLGHLYSFSKSEFMARYKLLKGFDVFLPFAFHGTGMPISAAANKLSEGDENTVGLLKSIGIEDTDPFKDARHWLYYFPQLAKDSLVKFQSYINWNHSFTTTDLNPFYDSFVKWQFSKLRNFISYGKKETIFCTKTNQPCLDHDRRTGEGVTPCIVEMKMVKLGDVYFCARIKKSDGKDKKSDGEDKNGNAGGKGGVLIAMGSKTRLYKAKMNDKLCILDHWALENMKHQEFEMELLGEISNSELPEIEKFRFLEKDLPPVLSYYAEKDFAYFEPESEVIGRAGTKCVVASVNQWFLNYDCLEWKSRVSSCIEEMNCLPETRKMLVDALGWIDKWGFSRTFGLGTSYDAYVIDSLSDSTIYMAFYCVKREFFSDIYGAEEKISVEFLTSEAWDFVFNLTDRNPYDDEKELVLERARSTFLRFYPVDLRVSGKDLIKNHLLFYIFHHVAIFSQSCWPRRIFTNGHLLLNNAKMSKSEGNFLTAEDVVKLFGANVTRIVLADAGNFNEDANFSQKLADAYVLKIFTLIQFVENFMKLKKLSRAQAENKIEDFVKAYKEFKVTGRGSGAGLCFGDELLKEGVDYLVERCDQAYEMMTYRDAVKYGFHEFKTLIELCVSLNCSEAALLYAIKKNLLVMYPIIPSMCDYLLEKYFEKNVEWPAISVEKENLSVGLEWYKKLSKNIFNRLSKSQKKSVRIYIGENRPEWKIQVRKINQNDIKGLREFFAKMGVNPKKGMSYVKDSVDYCFDERALLFGLKENLEKKLNTKVEIILNANRGEPYEPEVEFY